MSNPLNHFKNKMIDFEIYRNSNLLTTVKGLKNTEQSTSRKYINFFPDVDVQVGDILVNSGIKFYIIDIDTQTWQGSISSIKAYYQTTIPNEQPQSIVFNVGNATNSIFGNQQSAIINNSNFKIDDLKQLIELYGTEDKQRLYQLTSQLQECLAKNDLHKGMLAKFGDLIAKHSWLPLALSQILAGWLQGK